MFAKRMPRLAMVGLRRCIISSNQQHSGILNFIILENCTLNMRMSTLHNNICAFTVAFLHTNPVQNPTVQSMSTKESSGPRMGSIMEHPEYKEMYKRLSKEAKSDLDMVCLHIFSKTLIVNLDILELDALSPQSHVNKEYKGNAKIKEMENSETVKIGKFNIKDDKAIRSGFEGLLGETKVDQKTLKEELFAVNEKVDKKWDKAFMLKRQLVGFWLLQFVENGNLRLPMKAYDRLSWLHGGGKFSKKDDKAILAWVRKYGETGWEDLARSLGRNYLRAGAAVKLRYEMLLAGNKGAFSEEEDDFIIREVIKQVPDAFEKPYHEIKVNFKTISSQMEKRTNQAVHTRLIGLLHPTIMCYNAGTLDKDVRPKLIQKIKENKWIYGADVKFDKLALMPEFQGHNRRSLHQMYNSMMGNVRRKLGVNSHKEVTVDQVEEYFNTSTRHAKSEAQIEKEQRIVEAYNVAKRKQ